MKFMDNKLCSPYLTVCIACKGVSFLLQANISALQHQTLDKRQWEIVFLVTKKEQLLLIKDILRLSNLKAKCLTCFNENSLQKLRNQALSDIKTSLILFIDEDVILENPKHLKILVQLHKQHPKIAVLGGSYMSSQKSSFFGRAYNWITRLWMLENQNIIPAGNLSVKTNLLNFRCRFKSPLLCGFGGEEIYFFEQLKATGGQSLWERKLDASHWACHTLKDFLKRAITHGQSESLQGAKKSFYKSAIQFIKQPGHLQEKIPALLYLFLVKLTAVIYKFIRKR